MKIKRLIWPRRCPSRFFYNSMPFVCQGSMAAQSVAQSKRIVIFVFGEHPRRLRSPQLFARPTALAADSGAAAELRGISECELVSGTVSDSQLRWPLG